MNKLSLVIKSTKSVRAISLVAQTLKKSYSEFEFISPRDTYIVDEMIAKLSSCNSVTDLKRHANDYHVRIARRHSVISTFPKTYAKYKSAKTKEEVRIIEPYISGKKVLDFGCGSGYFTMLLSHMGYDIKGSDTGNLTNRSVLMPDMFVPVRSTGSYEKIAPKVDTTIIKSTLHHIDLGSQEDTLRIIANNTDRRIILDEEVFGDLGEYDSCEQSADFDSLKEFVSLKEEDQKAYIILVDYIGNHILGGVSDMNMPFTFRNKSEWISVIAKAGFRLKSSIPLYFSKWQLHRSSHLLMIFDKEK